MDSGNSSSVQSSSGGDEDAESISSFLGPHGGLTHHHPSNLHANSPRPPPSSFFDPLSTYLDAFTRSPPPPAVNTDSLLNLDMSWTCGSLRALDHPPNCTDVGAGLLGSVLPTRGSPAAAQAAASRGPFTGGIATNSLPSPSSSPPHHAPFAAPPSESPARTAAAAAPPQRSSRKRSRASRRAPTTVLTTDTSNFRAMVQEFTGIPAPPFSSSPFPPRSRFDLFHQAVSSPGTRSSGGVLSASPHSLLRPFAQKVPVPSFGPIAPGPSSSSPSSALAINTTAAASATPTTSGTKAEGSNLTRAFATDSAAADASSTHTASMANSFHLPPSVGDQHQSLLSMFNFQSSPSTRYSSLDAAVFGAARAMQESGRAMPRASDYAAGGRPGPASEGMPASTRRAGGSGAGDDLLQWVEGSGGSERGG